MIEVAIRHPYAGFELDVAFRSQARTLALFGDSGAGKTSVLDAIAGLLQPRHGRIVLDGRVLQDSRSGVRLAVTERRLGYVFQDGRLFPHLRVRGNLLYGARARRTRNSREFDTIVGLLELAPLLARYPRNLSGGERQRVAIGRALLAAPRALLLDEPLTGLHLDARHQVLSHLTRLKRELEVTTLLVTHQPEEVSALADEVLLLRAGRVVGQAPVNVFRAEHDRQRNPAQPGAPRAAALRDPSNRLG
ncbi:MAG TPA: ATP-binding cassette domain-containing protein [Rhodanobacteraceae bacterium]|nr:ATP-binding cassette domain-containing protein [Rhodanobacteraceae bacterium]